MSYGAGTWCQFTGEPVSAESLDRIVRNAVRGPSAGFSQGQAFLVLTGEDLKRFWQAGADAAAADSVRSAPLVIVPMSCKRAYLDRYALPDKGWTDRDERRWPVPFWHIDTGMAALLILLTAVDEGLAGPAAVPPRTSSTTAAGKAAQRTTMSATGRDDLVVAPVALPTGRRWRSPLHGPG